MKGDDIMKTLVAACIDQVLIFDSSQAFDRYINNLKGRTEFKIIKQVNKSDGSVHIRIKKQYGSSNFMEQEGNEYL